MRRRTFVGVLVAGVSALALQVRVSLPARWPWFATPMLIGPDGTVRFYYELGQVSYTTEAAALEAARGLRPPREWGPVAGYMAWEVRQ
jgi:hypothetical protein